ncbi:MAG: SDR family NAD(P)-dependent oxidoreductase [Acidobacteria bacterium]|nr:SDR family NAD(P)-dependent oxidoreductase [Acidobacteriota bacterium]
MYKVEDKKGNAWWLAAAVGVGAVTAYTVWGKPRQKYRFQDKTILITGGSRGLGLVLARNFASEGARIAICARDGEELNRAKEDLESRGAKVLDIVCDVRNQNEVNQMVEKVCNHYGQIDVLINNAGVIQVGPLEVQTKEDFEDAMNVHFWGPYYTMSAVIPKMRGKGEGRIVNISSIGGKLSVPHLAPYCASKFALVGLSGAMRVELAKDNIQVTTVCPGLMRTGSHVNALFKGKNEMEFAWFSIGNALPISSISAESAAKQIVKACRNGDAEAIISIQAELAAKMNALFPELVAEISGLVNKVLPSKGGIGEKHALGKDSTSLISPSLLTALIDKESYQNNELKPNEQLT